VTSAKRRAAGATGSAGMSPVARAFLLATAAVAVLNLVPYGGIALYPLALFATWIHELSHAAAALALGADLRGLVVRPDTSGLATYAFDPASFGTASRAITASAGYLGTAIGAAALLSFGARPKTHRPALLALAFLLVASVILWVRTAFGVAALLGLAAALGFLALRRSPAVARWTLWLLGIQTGLNALLDLRALYLVSGPTDARTMSQVVGLPAFFWATLWLAVGGLIVGRAAARILRM
jgi:hypothetical protein